MQSIKKVMPVIILESCKDDVLQVNNWYESKSYGLGDEFLRVFRASVVILPDYPNLHPEVFAPFRRVLLRRFPYSVYYVVYNDAIHVVGLFHEASNPRRLRKSLRKRRGSI